MSIAGDLHWERIVAGKYETLYYANGYKYRIEKEEARYYQTTPEWVIYYKWYHSTEKKWKRMSGFSSIQSTLKEAKATCTRHNVRPRAKYKYIGRANKDNILNSQHQYLGFLLFQQVDRRNGTPITYRTHFMDPSAVFKEIRDAS